MLPKLIPKKSPRKYQNPSSSCHCSINVGKLKFHEVPGSIPSSKTCQTVSVSGSKQGTIKAFQRDDLSHPFSPRRVSGQRRYTPDAFKQLTIIRVAKEAGFTLPEIRTLLNGISDDTPPSERWKTMAREKLPQVDALITRAKAMKRLLEEGLECDCMSLDECVILVEKLE